MLVIQEVQIMEKKITLQDMNYAVEHIKTPYAEANHEKYIYVFTSGHRLVIYETFGKRPYMGSFYGVNGTAGEVGAYGTAQDVLDEFNRLLGTNAIRADIMENFVA